MLNEKLKRYSVIADVKGLVFFFERLTQGVTSMSSMRSFTLSNRGKMQLNVEALAILSEGFNLLTLSDDIITPTDNLPTDFKDKEDVINWFSDLLLKEVLSENLINFSLVKFNDTKGIYLLEHCAIPFKFAGIRNLLIDLGFLSLEDDVFYRLNSTFPFEEISKFNRKISEKQLLANLERQREIGECGELFVLQLEKNKFKEHQFAHLIQKISSFDVAAGYDVVSFLDEKSTSIDKYIEVKTYQGKPHFHWSANEIKVAKIRGDQYFIYLVDLDKIVVPDYEPLVIQNPASYLNNNPNWLSTPDSFLFELIE